MEYYENTVQASVAAGLMLMQLRGLVAPKHGVTMCSAYQRTPRGYVPYVAVRYRNGPAYRATSAACAAAAAQRVCGQHWPSPGAVRRYYARRAGWKSCNLWQGRTAKRWRNSS